jgi:hypothetical protein
MPNSPDPWVEDARDLDNADQLLQSANGILEKTPAIADFLRPDSKKRIIVAPKGYGKTFLLKCKRTLLQKDHKQTFCLPENSMVDVTISDPPSLSRADVQRFADYSFWVQAWSAALMTSAVKGSAKFLSFRLEEFKSPVIRHLLASSQPVSPFDALKRLITSEKDFHRAKRAQDFSTLIMLFKQIRRPLAVFVDTIDEYLEGYVDKGQNGGETDYIHKNRDSRIWVVGQLGMCRAIRELLGVNSHIKIFASIRKEAFNDLEYFDNNAININSLVVLLKYTKDDLLHIIDKNILYVRQDNLVQPREANPIGRFLGSPNVRLLNPITRRAELFYDFLLRHTLHRPRDLMLIGGLIDNTGPAQRTQERVREAVYEAASQMIRLYLAEMRGFADIPAKSIFGLIPKNVLSKAEICRISELYKNDLEKRGLETNGIDPFVSLYRLGLVGVVRRTREQKYVQSFRQPHEIEREEVRPFLPDEKYFLIHPALDEIIKRARPDYFASFHTRNLIGHGYRWEEGKIFKCAIKGDIKRYSRVMNNPVIGDQFIRYLRREFENCKKEVEYAVLEGGDSVVFIDDSADRVISAARCVEEAARRFQIPQSFRFGAHVGAVAFSKDDGENVQSPTVGLAIRAASRIEPYASPGTILCTEEFFSEVDESIRGSFTPVETLCSSQSGLSIEIDGSAVIRKSDEDEPINTKLFQFPLCSTA